MNLFSTKVDLTPRGIAESSDYGVGKNILEVLKKEPTEYVEKVDT